MLKKILGTLLFTVVIAIFMGFTTTEVMAECVAPDCFSADGCEIRAVTGSNGEFPIVIDSSNCADYPDYCPIEEPYPYAVFAYNFDVTCRYSGLAIAMPAPEHQTNCPDSQFNVIYTDPDEVVWQPAGTGATARNWHVGDETIRVLTLPSALPSNLKGFFFVTNTEVSTKPQPIILYSGNKTFFSSIWAADCVGPEPLIAETDFTFTITGVDGIQHKCTVTRDQRGKLLAISIDGEDVPLANWLPMSDFVYCVPEAGGAWTFNGKEYECHIGLEAADRSALTGNPTGSNAVFIKPPGIWIKF